MEEWLDEQPKIKLFAHHWVHDSARSGDSMLATLDRSQDLDLIRSGVAPPDQLRLDLGWHRPRSKLYFALADSFLVERGSRGAACRRQIGVDGGTITDRWVRGRQALDFTIVQHKSFRHKRGPEWLLSTRRFLGTRDKQYRVN